MTKRFKQKINSVYSIINIIFLTLQSFMPGFFAFMPTQAHAAETVEVGEVALGFSKDSHEFDLNVETTNDLSYEINYDLTDLVEGEEAKQGGVVGVAYSNDGVATATQFAGSCSTDGCTKDEFDSGVLEIPAADYSADFVLDNDTLWLLANNKATVSEVELGTIYSAPQNDQVQVVFTKLPENPGSLTIEEITLSETQVTELGAYSNVAYDITSNMENGTFEYELKLPLPEGADETAGMVYAESVEELSAGKANAVASDSVEGKVVKATGLDHFTVFVVTDDEAIYSAPWIDYATQGYLNTGVHYPTNVVAGETATWNFSTITSGTYKVYVSWSTHPNRTQVAPYDLTHTASVEHREINQEQLADQTTTGASAQWSNWYYYGEYTLDATSKMVLTGVDNTSGTDYVIADEVLLANVATAPDTVWVDDGYGLNLNNDSHVWGYDAFATISDAVAAVADGGEILVKDGSYDGGIVINKSVNLHSENGKATTTISSSGVLPISIGSDDVTVDGFTITNSTGTHGLVSTDNSNLIIKNNRFTNIHSNSSNAHAVAIVSGSRDVSNIEIDSNVFDDIGYFGTLTTGYSASAVAVGWSNGTAIIDSVHITNNVISDIHSEGSIFVWKQSKGAYGVIINNAGSTPNLLIENNSISDLEGLWSHGIGLEGPTPNAIVRHNILSDLVDYKDPSDGIGIFFEANPDAGSVIVENNSLATSMGWGVAIHPDLMTAMPSLVVDASKNWWGDASGPSVYGPGTGVAVGSQIEVCPWLSTSDLDNPTYAGGCLGYVQGRTFVDQSNNGLLLSADGDYPSGMTDGFTVRLYDASWNILGEQTTRTTANVGQYYFDGLLNEDTTYRVCGVDRVGYDESSPLSGQHVVTTSNTTPPSQYSDAVIVTNASSASDENKVCWETSISSSTNGAYLGIGYVEEDTTPPAAPTGLRRLSATDHSVVFACGDTAQIQSMHPDWDDNTESDFDYYEYSSFNAPSGAIGIDERRFDDSIFEYNGSWLPSEGTYGFAVRAVDKAGNKSAWSLSGETLAGSCQITYDSTSPAIPALVSPSDGAHVQPTGLFLDWDDVTDSSSPVTYYYQSSYSSSVGANNGLTSVIYGPQPLSDSKINASGSADNRYYWQVKACDAVGNCSDWSGPWEVTIDINSPTVDLVFPTPGSSATSFQAVFSEDVIASEAENPANYFLNNWPGAGGTGDLVGDATIVYDAPTKTATITFTNSGWYISPEQQWGVQNIHDLANNLQQVNPYEEYSTPMVAPVTVDSGTDANWHATSVAVNFTCSDVDGSGCKTTYYTIDGTDPTTASSTGNSVTISSDGIHTVKYFSVDNAGNVESIKTAANTVKIDTVNPESIITTFGLSDGGSVETATFSGQIQGTATDLPVATASGVDHVLLEIMHNPFGATESSYWNGSDWQAAATTVTATGTDTWEYQIAPPEKVLEGTYNVASHAVDTAGNVETTYKIIIVYDKTIPEVILNMDPTNPDGNNSWYVTEPTVTLTASDNYSLDRIEYQWNSTTGTWKTYGSPITPPGEGQNILYYRSIDKVGNISDLGIKEVKYDKTAPTDGAGNLQVKNIKSTTADATWNDPANSDEIDRFVLIWKHEDGSTRSKSVAGDVRETDLFDLFDGEWELTLESQDAAGNAYKVTEKFTVGGSSDSGDVLGATTDQTTGDTTGLGGLVAGVSNLLAGTNEEVDTQAEAKILPESEEEAGTVLGESDSSCVTWKFYLPLFLLIIQIMFAFSLEIANREPGMKKMLMALAISGLMIASFYIFRGTDCYVDGDIMQTIAKWFAPISILVAFLLRGIGSATVEDK